MGCLVRDGGGDERDPARARHRRDRILLAGCYHGHADGLLASAGSGLATLGIPSSPGVPSGTTADTIVTTYNDADAAAAAVERYGEGLAAIVVEPVAGNMGVVPPAPGFLEALRTLCDASVLLVFDEVITGFRVARGGAQERYGVLPDLTVLGKIVGERAAARGVRRPRRRDGAAGAGGRRLPGRHALRQPARDRRRAGVLRRLRDPRSTTSWRRRGARPALRRSAASARRRDGDALPRAARHSATSTTPGRATRALRRALPHLLERGVATSRRRQCLFVSLAHSTRTSTAPSRPLPTSSRLDLFGVIAAEAAAESPLWGEQLRAEPEHEAVFGPLAPERFALGLETIYEGYLVHYGGRACSTPRTTRLRPSATTSTPTVSSASPRRGDRRGRRTRRADLDLRPPARERGRRRRRGVARGGRQARRRNADRAVAEQALARHAARLG